MIFLADESVDRQVVERLRQEGFTVQYVAEMQPGISDDTVLSLSNQAGALLLTADKDFGELVYRLGRQSSGVILIRLSGLSNEGKAATVVMIFKRHSHEFQNAFTVIEPGMIRIRRKTE